MKNIALRRLTSDFYSKHTHLKEVLDFDEATGKMKDKGRGFGVCLVDILGHQFAIPLRSNMSHKDNFPTKFSKDASGNLSRQGLDYSKAVIITNGQFVSTKPFKTRDKEEYLKINRSEKRILKEFEEYVNKYIEAVRTSDKNVIEEYEYSTLVNYHVELGL